MHPTALLIFIVFTFHYLHVNSHRASQVFLDVVESVNLLVNSNGTVVRSEVVGALKMRTYLSGMPECKLGLNDKARPLPPPPPGG